MRQKPTGCANFLRESKCSLDGLSLGCLGCTDDHRWVISHPREARLVDRIPQPTRGVVQHGET